MAKTRAALEEQEHAREELRALLPPGSTVYTVLRHVSRSGMTRDLDLYVMENGEPRRITWSACKATGITYNGRAGAMRVEGCGMDMGFHAVYTLSHYLYPQGFECIGAECPSNDHSNNPREDYRGVVHASGGYALEHRWL